MRVWFCFQFTLQFICKIDFVSVFDVVVLFEIINIVMIVLKCPIIYVKHHDR